MGRSLAENKITQIKANLNQIGENVKKAVATIEKEIDSQHDERKPSLAEPEKEIAALGQTTDKVIAEANRVGELQKGLLDEGQEDLTSDPPKDDELSSLVKAVQASMKQATTHFQKFRDQEKVLKEQAEAGKSGGLFNKERTEQEKNDMAAFLSGKTD